MRLFSPGLAVSRLETKSWILLLQKSLFTDVFCDELAVFFNFFLSPILYISLSLQHKLTFHISHTHSRFLLFVLLAFSLSLCCHSPSVSITLSHTSTFSLSLTSTSFDNFMLFGSPLSPSGLKDQMLEVAFGFSIRRRRSQGNAICISFYG